MIRIKGTILHGLIGDLYAFNGLPFSPRLDGTMDYSPPREIYTDDFSFSPRIKGTLVYSDEQAQFRITLPLLYIRFDATVSIEGTLTLTLPRLGVNLSGYSSVEGTLSVDIPKQYIKLTGQEEIQGTLNAIISRWSFDGSGFINETGVLTVRIPMVRFSGTTEYGNTGTLEFEIPMYRISFDGHVSAEGTLNVSIPMLYFHADQLVESDDYLTMVMNTKNKALTLYNNYLFNSMCAFGGKHFGATDTGIFDLDSGKLDNGVPIEWNVKTGYLDLEQKQKKKLVEAWVSYKTDGDISLNVIQPDGEEYEYILQGIDPTETGLRLKFGKGIRTKYVALNIKNIDGSTIDLDELKLHLANSTFVKVR